MTEAPAEFLVPLSDQSVKELETATFQCEVSKSGLKPIWRKGDVDLGPSDRMQMSSISTKHMLTIRESELDDQAQYTIIVEEGVQSTASLSVKGRKWHTDNDFTLQ